MRTVAEITTLIKYLPKRKRMLITIKGNIQFKHEDLIDEYESLSKLCVTRWTVGATAFQKVIANFQPLYDLCDVCLINILDRKTLEPNSLISF